MKLTKYLVLTASIATLLAQFSSVPAGAGSRNSPSGQIEVVTINLEEAYTQDPSSPRTGGDLASHFEIPNFVDRVIRETRHFPDVLLVQEVNYETSGFLARQMSSRTGQRYVVAVRPVRNTSVEYSGKIVHTETAIIINTTTMKVAKKGGYYSANLPRSAAAPGRKVKVARHAYVLAQERASGIRVPLVSVHFVNLADMRSARLSNYWRGEWVKDLGGILERKYSAQSKNRLTNFGGDFNMKACYTGSVPSCNHSRYWRFLTGRPYNFSDPLFERGIDGVDRILSAGTVVEAEWDRDGNFPETDRSRYYSDHRFRWSVVTP